MGLIPGGTIRNRDFRLPLIERAAEISNERLLILFDAQTSGGLLISVPQTEADALLKSLHEQGVKEATIIGEVLEQPRGKIVIK